MVKVEQVKVYKHKETSELLRIEEHTSGNWLRGETKEDQLRMVDLVCQYGDINKALKKEYVLAETIGKPDNIK